MSCQLAVGFFSLFSLFIIFALDYAVKEVVFVETSIINKPSALFELHSKLLSVLLARAKNKKKRTTKEINSLFTGDIFFVVVEKGKRHPQARLIIDCVILLIYLPDSKAVACSLKLPLLNYSYRN